MTRLTEENRQIAAGAIRMRGQDAWSLACMRARGEEQKARDYLDELNACRARVGGKPFAMPEPATTGLPDVIACPAEPKRKTLGISVRRAA